MSPKDAKAEVNKTAKPKGLAKDKGNKSQVKDKSDWFCPACGFLVSVNGRNVGPAANLSRCSERWLLAIISFS